MTDTGHPGARFACRCASVELPPEPSSPAAARRFVADALSARGLDPVVPVMVLLVSELVTNAVRYADGPVRLRLAAGADAVRVEVSDEVPDPPRPRPVPDLAEHGRGLLIVEALATRSGVDPLPRGKRVWFELDLDGE